MIKDLRGHLVADAGVSAITTSVRVSRADQSDGDTYIVLHKISGDHEHHMLAATGKATARVQIDCYGSTPAAADSLAEAVRQSLDGFRGLMNSNTFISRCHLDNERTAYETPVSGAHSEGGNDSVQLDYMIAWTLSVPTFS